MKLRKITKLAKDILLVKVFKRKIPIRVKHHITYRCNLMCPFCLFNKKLNQPDNSEMNTSRVKKMMAEFKKMGTKFWLFCGGEPFLREDLGELINYAKDEMDFHCSLTTNGVLLTERIKGDPSFKRLDLVQISLDGPEKIQDRLRGAGTYEKIIYALDTLRKLCIKTTIMVLITKDNLNYLGCLVKIADRYNANIAFQAAGTEPAGWPGLKEDFFPDRKIFKKAIEELIKEKKKTRLIVSSFSYLKMLKDCWPDIPHKIKCYAGQFYCDITPEGFVAPCCAKLDFTDANYHGLGIGFQNAFFNLDNMTGCRDCYYAGPQELNIVWEMIPLRIKTLYRDYLRRKII